MNSVTVISPINIALIKYWGKRDDHLNLPLNSSLSITLDTDQIFTKTQVSKSELHDDDALIINQEIQTISKTSRIRKVLDAVNNITSNKSKFLIESTNSFPTAAGMASSASAFCALSLALSKIFNLSFNETSILSRIGSGSSCRSLFGGFVIWQKGEIPDGSDSIPNQIFDSTHWPSLNIISLIVSDVEKSKPSSLGMKNSQETSELLRLRVLYQVEERLKKLVHSIKERNFEEFSKLVIKDSNSFHAICLDTYPPINPPYLNESSYSIMRLIDSWNSNSTFNKAAYSFDAGPNAFIFIEDNNLDEFFQLISKVGVLDYLETDYFKKDPTMQFEWLSSGDYSSLLKIKKIIKCKVGKGPFVLSSN